MKRLVLAGAALLGLFGAAAYLEYLNFTAHAQKTALVITPESAVLKPSPIRKDWIIEGEPKTEAAMIARTDDGSTKVFVWQTTKSRFTWTYGFDEVVHVIDGEVFLTDRSGKERRAGPGDVIFFPAGTKVTWRVPDHVKKIATMKNALPKPIASVMRWVRMARDSATPTEAFAD